MNIKDIEIGKYYYTCRASNFIQAASLLVCPSEQHEDVCFIPHLVIDKVSNGKHSQVKFKRIENDKYFNGPTFHISWIREVADTSKNIKPVKHSYNRLTYLE